MAEGTRSIEIGRPVADVFAFMNEVEREHEWQPSLVEATQSPPGPTRVGSERHYVSEFMGKRVENRYVVRVWEPDVRFVLETTDDSTLDATSEVRFESTASGTRVTMSVVGSPRGALRFVPDRLLEGTFTAELDGALARLKEILEA